MMFTKRNQGWVEKIAGEERRVGNWPAVKEKKKDR